MDAHRPQTCLASTQALQSRRVSSASKSPDYVVAHWSDRYGTGQTGPMLLYLHLRSLVLAMWIYQGTLWFSSEPLETPRTWFSQSPFMIRFPRSPGSILVLRLYQETIHNFILAFLLPCGPHLTSLATGSLEPSLLVFSTPGGLTGNDLSRLFFTCTNTSKAPTCTCNT
jgi:hypothetical protein